MELAILVVFLVVVAAIGGFILRAHMQTVAQDAAKVVSRATTIPAGDLSALHDKLDAIATNVTQLITPAKS